MPCPGDECNMPVKRHAAPAKVGLYREAGQANLERLDSRQRRDELRNAVDSICIAMIGSPQVTMCAAILYGTFRGTVQADAGCQSYRNRFAVQLNLGNALPCTLDVGNC